MNKISKFVRVPLLQRVVSVSASNAGSFAALKAECIPSPIIPEGNTFAEDLGAIQPYFLPRGEDDELSPRIGHDSARLPPPMSSISRTTLRDSSVDGIDREYDEDGDGEAVKEDISTILSLIDLLDCDALQRKSGRQGVFVETNLAYGGDVMIAVDSIFEFPVHRVILASRSPVLNDVILGKRIGDPAGRLRCYMVDSGPASFTPVMFLSGLHPLSALLLAVYLYTDDIPAIWDRRVFSLVSDRLVECSPRTNALSIRDDLRSLSSLLQLPALGEALNATVKRPLAPSLTYDMKALLERSLRGNNTPISHPLAPDTILELGDAHVWCHSTILRARSPFFAALFGDPDWTINRRRHDSTLAVKFEHRRLRVMEYILRFIYIGGDEQLFAILGERLKPFPLTFIQIFYNLA